MLLAFCLLLFAVLGGSLRLRASRDPRNVLSGPNLHYRIQALFEPFEGARVTPEERESLEQRADTLFRDILTGVGLVPIGWDVRVELDDVLGPVPRVHGPLGEVMAIAAFEHRLREGSLQL